MVMEEIAYFTLLQRHVWCMTSIVFGYCGVYQINFRTSLISTVFTKTGICSTYSHNTSTFSIYLLMLLIEFLLCVIGCSAL